MQIVLSLGGACFSSLSINRFHYIRITSLNVLPKRLLPLLGIGVGWAVPSKAFNFSGSENDTLATVNPTEAQISQYHKSQILINRIIVFTNLLKQLKTQHNSRFFA